MKAIILAGAVALTAFFTMTVGAQPALTIYNQNFAALHRALLVVNLPSLWS